MNKNFITVQDEAAIVKKEYDKYQIAKYEYSKAYQAAKDKGLPITPRGDIDYAALESVTPPDVALANVKTLETVSKNPSTVATPINKNDAEVIKQLQGVVGG